MLELECFQSKLVSSSKLYTFSPRFSSSFQQETHNLFFFRFFVSFSFKLQIHQFFKTHQYTDLAASKHDLVSTFHGREQYGSILHLLWWSKILAVKNMMVFAIIHYYIIIVHERFVQKYDRQKYGRISEKRPFLTTILFTSSFNLFLS